MALELANLQSKTQGSLDGATFNSFYQGMIGKLGTDGEEAYRLNKTSEKLLVTLSGNRDSVSSVSLDEEMTNMITFQQAYNANARMITVVDETLDKIINGMGRVGL
jgi:flagellar hook-associated protein 1 FlgK